MTVRVYDLAHARTGDKGHGVNVAVIAYDQAGYAHLDRHLTAEKVMAAFAHFAAGPVHRYPLPRLRAFNFVVDHALGGGVTANLSQDLHGKSLSSLMLTITLPDRDETR
ncbi:MAG: hypothetical protein QF926_12230 [Alphaproteobacteria bacterium]|jgi:hypothetical protein|nr:hypothetical protein [Alphaproteobacteria bacterium]|tara:strand:- start:444 stop:770 length:327 start_codon:yes stop_codon:yes gene_type:complete